tara:strand:- start:2123 stop:2260 length:138 start_codon:yes stop_codon:yes gene_type:complete
MNGIGGQQVDRYFAKVLGEILSRDASSSGVFNCLAGLIIDIVFFK